MKYLVLSFLFISSWSFAQIDWNSSGLSYEDACKMLKDAYPDGLYIIQQADQEEVEFWLSAGMMDPDGIETIDGAVHETLHGYDNQLGGFDKHGYFISQGIEIIMDGPGIFRSDEMKDLVPEGLRNGRYKTYVLDEDDTDFGDLNIEGAEEFQNITISSVSEGIYGLLEEFNAYYHGLQAAINLINKGYAKSGLKGVIDGMESYYEFNTFMACYLIYAQKERPEDYQQVIKNQNLVVCYTLVEKRFNLLVEMVKSKENLSNYYSLEGEEYYTETYQSAIGVLYDKSINESNYKDHLKN